MTDFISAQGYGDVKTKRTSRGWIYFSLQQAAVEIILQISKCPQTSCSVAWPFATAGFATNIHNLHWSPPTHKQHTEAEKTPFSTSSVAGGPEYVLNIDAPQVPKKKKQGKVGNLHVVLLNEVWMLTIFSPRMNFSKIGYPYEQPIWEKSWN